MFMYKTKREIDKDMRLFRLTTDQKNRTIHINKHLNIIQGT